VVCVAREGATAIAAGRGGQLQGTWQGCLGACPVQHGRLRWCWLQAHRFKLVINLVDNATRIALQQVLSVVP
jgi:hypothetical protein